MKKSLEAGAQPAFPPSVVVDVKRLACELPSHSDVPLARFTIPELHREVLARGLVAQISGVTLWRWLSADALQPWRHRSWIFPRDPQFAEKAGRVLDLYGLVTPEIAPVVVREGYDAVVKRLLFERAGRPEYLIDRHPVKARLAESGDETNPFRFLFAREIPNLGITRARTYYYSVYAIDWKVVDQTRIRIARRGPASWTNAGSLPGGG